MAARLRLTFAGLAAALASTFGASIARAFDPVHPPPPPAPIFWSPDWPRFRAVEGVGSGMLGGLSLYLFFNSPESPWWKSTNRFDESIHRRILPGSIRTREIAARISDIGVLTLLLDAVIIDPLVAIGPRRSLDVGEQVGMINGEALIFALTVQTIMTDVVGRERPFGRLCIGKEADSLRCKSAARYRSFYSGHTTMAFTSASLNCTTHLNLPLYGKPWDSVACGAGLGLAATVGTMRMMADRHYLTDVLLGASIGVTSGFFVPWVLHYRGGLLDTSRGPGLLVPRPVQSIPIGPFWSGAF